MAEGGPSLKEALGGLSLDILFVIKFLFDYFDVMYKICLPRFRSVTNNLP